MCAWVRKITVFLTWSPLLDPPVFASLFALKQWIILSVLKAVFDCHQSISPTTLLRCCILQFMRCSGFKHEGRWTRWLQAGTAGSTVPGAELSCGTPQSHDVADVPLTMTGSPPQTILSIIQCTNNPTVDSPKWYRFRPFRCAFTSLLGFSTKPDDLINIERCLMFCLNAAPAPLCSVRLLLNCFRLRSPRWLIW